MRSVLKRIYDVRKGYDAFNIQKFYLNNNPIYQVDKFIGNININLIENFRKNMSDIVILEDNEYYYDNCSNMLYCDKKSNDIWGLLHVASNDQKKMNVGIITNDDFGIGLNEGITEVFENELGVHNYRYLLESVVARVLLAIDFDLVTHSYFTNSGDDLILFGDSIKGLIVNVDKYFKNHNEVMRLYKEKNEKKDSEFKNLEKKKYINELNNCIFDIECDIYVNVYNIIENLIRVISESNLNEFEKQGLYKLAKEELRAVFSIKELGYLYELTYEFGKYIKVKKKVK